MILSLLFRYLCTHQNTKLSEKHKLTYYKSGVPTGHSMCPRATPSSLKQSQTIIYRIQIAYNYNRETNIRITMQMRVAIRVTFLCAQKQGTLRPYVRPKISTSVRVSDSCPISLTIYENFVVLRERIKYE